MHAFVQDLRHSARMFARQPGLWTLAVIALALGVGVNSTVFSLIRGLIMRPLSVLDPDRTAVLLPHNPRQARERERAFPAEFAEWRAQSRSFERLVAFDTSARSLTGVGEPEAVEAAEVSEGFLEFLRARMTLGRTFLPEESVRGRHRVAVIGHGLWQRRCAGDPAIVGKTLRLDNGVYTVVGVAAPELWFPSTRVQIWLPLPAGPSVDDWRLRNLTVLGRLRPGVRLAEAQQEMSAVAGRLAAAYPQTNAGWNVEVLPPYEGLVGPTDQTAIRLLYFLGAGVLMIACANVANLLLVRAVGRRREIAIRQALGASRGRLLRQAVAEGLWLAVPAGLLGLLTAAWCADVLVRAFPNAILKIPEQVIDWTAAGFTLGVSLASVLLFSLAPSWQAAALRLSEALQAGARTGLAPRSRRLARAFAALQTALALGLVAAAIMTAKGIITLHHLDPGFQTHSMAMLSASPAAWRYGTAAQAQPYYEELLRRVRTVPGVESAGALRAVPQVQGDGTPTTFLAEGRPEPPPGERPFGAYVQVTPGALETLRIPLLCGRSIQPADIPGAQRVVVVNQTAARRSWPGQPAEGRHVRLDALAGEWFTVVGVCRDLVNPNRPPQPQFYVPVAQNPRRAMTVVARLGGPPDALLPALRQAARETDPEEPVRLTTVEEEMYRDLGGPRTFTAMLAVMGALALFLAAMGLFCLLSHQVAQQLPEIGIRMALGARPADIVAQVSGQALRVVAVGTVLGLGLAYAAGRVLASLLPGLKPADPALLALAMLVLALAAAVACWAPVRSAASAEPAKVLRSE